MPSDGAFEDDGDDAFEDEDEQLRKIFEEYKPEKAEVDPSKAKAIKLEVLEKRKNADDASAEATSTTTPSKKRVAHQALAVSKSAAPKKPLRRSASQILMDRYKQLQTKKEDNEIEAQMQRLMEGKQRVAHTPAQ